MFKRLLIFIMVFALGAPMLYACDTIVTRDDAKDMSQPVAIIAPREMTYKDSEGNTKVYKDEERVITKGQLWEAYLSQANQYQQQTGSSVLKTGTSVEDIINNTLDQLINRELYLREANFLIAKGDIVIKQADLNKIWKDVYKAIDNAIYSYEKEIAKQFGEEIYEKGNGSEPEQKYPSRLDYYSPEFEDDNRDEPKWTPERVMYPQFYEGMSEDSFKSASRTVEAMRRFVESLVKTIEDKKGLLTPAELQKYNADLEKLADFKNAKPADYVDIYPMFQELWMVEYLLYQQAYEELLTNKLLDYVVKDAKDKVKPEDVQREYNTILARQIASFDANIANYKSARDNVEKGGKEYVILYDPAGVEQFYVKHILLPYDEGDTSMNMANIAVYERDEYGNEMIEKGKKSVDRVYNEIKAAMRGLTGEENAKIADYVFTDFIFKYNTDPGIFNSKLGYGLRANDASDYVEQFEKAAKDLYKQGIIGAISEPVNTTFGVHILMLSSIIKPGVKLLTDHTDVTKTKTYFDAIKERLVQQQEQAAIENYNYYLNDKIKGEWSGDITKYEDRYSNIIRDLKKQQAALV